MANFDKINKDIAWCPGCGNFSILKVLKESMQELNLDPRNVVLVSGIGQAAKIPQYLETHYFNGLHGRAIPAATGIKLANSGLKVIVVSGDGDIYGEGGNHFIHAIRRNPDITVIVSNNMVYGLTKGQVSPTSDYGFVSKSRSKQYQGEFNPISTAISLDASFVSRGFVLNQIHLKAVMKEAISHKGFSLLDVYSPCVTFDTKHTYDWFKENTYELDSSYNAIDKVRAFEKSLEKEKLPIGVFYKNDRAIFEESEVNMEKTQQAFYMHNQDRREVLGNLIESFK